MINEIIEKLREFTNDHHIKLWMNAGSEGPIYDFMFEKECYDGYVDWFKFCIDVNGVEDVNETVNSISEYYLRRIYGPDAVTM